MRSTVLWIVGEPGVGKTTFARTLLESRGTRAGENDSPKWTEFGATTTAAGWWRGGKFDGADTLAISQIKPAIEYLVSLCKTTSAVHVIDGDKLSNANAVKAVQDVGARMVCVYLHGQTVARERRLARSTTQNESWVKGRATKAERFFRSFPGEVISVCASDDMAGQLEMVRGWL